jgi:hypothetical protein
VVLPYKDNRLEGLLMDKWLIMAALLGLLGLALWVAYRQWMLVDIDLPPWAWLAMGLGAGLTLLVGGALMALIFYSSRKGYDEPPQNIEPPDEQA